MITSNPGKLREFQHELSRMDMRIRLVKESYEEIQADSLAEVVRHGLRELRGRGLDDFIIDDSGLFIDSLGGFPGVYSAYALRTLGCRGILKLMKGERSRGARFRCCIGAIVNGIEIVVEEEAMGQLTLEERGRGGFGFDPIFRPSGDDRTYAEIPLEDKNLISHRGKALRSFSKELEKMAVRP